MTHIQTDSRAREGLFDRTFDGFARRFSEPGPEFDLNIVRVIVAVFFLWKLLSRDFGFYGTVPEGVFPYYPVHIYPAHSYILWTGLPGISELLTFHWIHWILPRPDETGMRVVQGLAMLSLTLMAVFGRGPRRILAILSYCLMIYLWGYLFLGGHEIDAVLLYFGLLVVLIFAGYDDRPLWRLRSLGRAAPTRAGGQGISLLFLVFVTYYFASGVNKLTDISLLEWFTYDLVQDMEFTAVRAANSTLHTPGIFRHLFEVELLNLLGPAFIYISHLIVPIVFFRRHHVWKFFLVYALFHFMTFGVGISFTGYVFVWFVLFPWQRLIFGRPDGPVSGGASGAAQ